RSGPSGWIFPLRSRTQRNQATTQDRIVKMDYHEFSKESAGCARGVRWLSHRPATVRRHPKTGNAMQTTIIRAFAVMSVAISTGTLARCVHHTPRSEEHTSELQ